jgi:hypothetical protein
VDYVWRINSVGLEDWELKIIDQHQGRRRMPVLLRIRISTTGEEGSIFT